MGGRLVQVNGLTGVDGRFSFRSTERAGTALLVCGNTGVAAIRGLLKRGGLTAARVCKRIVKDAVVQSLGGYRGEWLALLSVRCLLWE